MRTERALLAAALLLVAGCGDDSQPCGAVQPAATETELVTADGQTFRYGGFHAALAGDCPVVVGSRGSVTITGRQPDSNFPLTFCVRREGDVRSGQAIQLADDTFIQVVDVSAKDGAGCTYGKDAGATPTGTISFDGFCTAAGTEYNLTLAGAIGGVRTCLASDAGPASSTPITLQLAGTVRVTMDAASAP